MDPLANNFPLLAWIHTYAIPLRILNIAVLALAISFFLIRALVNRSNQSRPMSLRLLMVSTLLMVPAITQYIEVAYVQAPDWLYLLSHICFPLGELAGYVALVEMLQSWSYELHEILKLPVIRTVLVLLMIMVLIEASAGRSGSFNLTRLFRNDWAFIASNAIFLTSILIQPPAIFVLLYRGMRHQRNIIFHARCLLGIVSCACAMTGPVLGFVNIWLFLQHSPLIVPIEIFVNYVMLNVTLVLFLVSFALPNSLFVRIAAPLIWLLKRQQWREERQLHELHQQMVALVPVVQLVNNPPFTRKLVEISEARMLLWSHIPLNGQPTPAEEAQTIRRFQAEQATIEEPGAFAPRIEIDDVYEYNLAVARLLRQDSSPQH